MSPGIRATVTIDDPDACPVAAFSAASESRIEQVSRSVGNGNETGSVSEFLAPTEEPADHELLAGPLFSYGASSIYRRRHDGIDCPCACLGSFGCPSHRYVADSGALTLVFHAEDFDQLQQVMEMLRERYPSLDVNQLLQPPLEGTPEEQVFVNRGSLTERQLEVLTLAYERGYFERPKGANATELAAELEISQSTFTEHLVTAQTKLLGDILGDETGRK